MRTSPRHPSRYPEASSPPGPPFPDEGDREGELPYEGQRSSGASHEPQRSAGYAGYEAPLFDEEAYARALYGSGDTVYSGPGTGLGYTDGPWGQGRHGDSWYGDPDATDPDLAGAAYARTVYGEPGPAASPMEDPTLGHQVPWYQPSAPPSHLGYHPSTTPRPGLGPPAYAPAEPEYYDDQDVGPDDRSLHVGRLHRRSLGRAASRRASELVNGAGMTIIAGISVVVIGVGLAIVAGRMMTTRQLFFTTHAAAGILCVHAFGGGLTTLVLRKETRAKELVRKWSTIAMAASAWVTMFVGTFFGYAGYRADPLPGVVNLNAYPQKFLLANKGLAFWETFGMEWKVNSGWLCPFLATAVAFVVLRYNHLLVRDLRLRRMLTNLFLMAFAIAIVGSMMGFIVNTVAPNDFMHRPWKP